MKLLGVIVFSFLGFSSYISYNQAKEVLYETKKGLYQEAVSFSRLSVTSFGNLYLNYYNSGFLTFANQTTDLLKLNRDIKKVQIVDSKGQVLYDSSLIHEGDLNPPVLTDIALSDQKIVAGVVNAETQFLPNAENDVTRILIPYTDPFGFRPFSVLYNLSYDRAQILADKTLWSIITSALFSTLAVILLTSIVLNLSVLSPLSKVIFGAKRISSGQLDFLIKIKNRDEIGDLAEAVSTMAAALRKDIEDLKKLDKLKDEFIIIASHNLRTPLTAMRGYLDFLTTDLTKIDEKDKTYLANATQATDKLNKLIEELIKIVNIKSGQNPYNKEPVAVETIIEEALTNTASMIEERKITVKRTASSVPKILADKQAIVSVLYNILDNAVKFSLEGGEVEITTKAEKNEVIVSVTDHGKGMTAEELDLLFEKFHRGTDSLTYDYEGVGIGLYLNYLIVSSQGGRIWATSKVKEGSTFNFSLPVAGNNTANQPA